MPYGRAVVALQRVLTENRLIREHHEPDRRNVAHARMPSGSHLTDPAIVRMLELQRGAGNRAVASLMPSPSRPMRASGRVLARFEAWEHRELGDEHGGEGRKVTLPNGVTLTYGQMVALSGDFYRSPEALFRAPADELNRVLATMERERGEAKAGGGSPTQGQINENNAAYEMATTGHERVGYNVDPFGGDATAAGGPHGEVRDGEHVESGAPGAEAGFLDLAAANAAHFSPENIKLNYKPKHQLALDLALQAWTARNPGATATPMAGGDLPSAREHTRPPEPIAAPGAATPGGTPATSVMAPPQSTPTAPGTAGGDFGGARDQQLEAQAWVSAGFADHFLTDAFAAGHLISGSVGREVCGGWWNAHKTEIRSACWLCTMQEGLSPGIAAAVNGALEAIVGDKLDSLLLKIVHDYFNATGIEVRNAAGAAWRTFGDGHLAKSPETKAQGELSSKASRDSVEDVLRTGTTNRALAALDFIPDVARFEAGGFEEIQLFATNRAVWETVLARTTLSQDPSKNELYKLVKGNVAPIASLQVQKGVRSVSDAVKKQWDGFVEGVESLGREWDQGIRRLYGAPF